ncbi:hypothetical protein F5Y14DRAFT_412317 [Nemania sp. NC0429]|nr:hypothetical protein F5Y14DRAFT_412317 [Nemania sp. NC0429]
MLRNVLLAGALAALASADFTPQEGTTTTNLCRYKSGSGGVPPTPIPTVSTSWGNVHSTTTAANIVVPTTIWLTAPTLTVTDATYTPWEPIETTSTTATTITHQAYAQGPTATFVSTVCAGNAKPAVTVTKYTGTYAASQGQVTTYPATYPTEATCGRATLTITALWGYTSSGTVTATYTPKVTVTSITTTSTFTWTWTTHWVYTPTYHTTITSHTIVPATRTTTVACPAATMTRTLDARCAPSNLVGAIDGKGIYLARYAVDSGYVLSPGEPWGSDPSSCCQACLDDKACGASWSGYRGCGLFYVVDELKGQPQCGAWVVSWQADSTVIPGQGYILQSGCGIVGLEPRWWE